MARTPSKYRDPLPQVEPPSKTQLKKQMQDLQELGEAVASLPASRLEALPIEERLRDAIAELHRTRSFEGKRRQIQYIGKLMRVEDVEPLREAVAAFRLGHAQDALAMHEAEAWRERLLADDEALNAWVEAHPRTDTQQLRSLVRSARKEMLPEGARHGRAYRELFQLVKSHLKGEAGGSDDGEGLDDRDGGHDA
jgi:ribosome-associated protein